MKIKYSSEVFGISKPPVLHYNLACSSISSGWKVTGAAASCLLDVTQSHFMSASSAEHDEGSTAAVVQRRKGYSKWTHKRKGSNTLFCQPEAASPTTWQKVLFQLQTARIRLRRMLSVESHIWSGGALESKLHDSTCPVGLPTCSHTFSYTQLSSQQIHTIQ